MPVEIREINIKTEVRTVQDDMSLNFSEKELKSLKMELLDECNRMISSKVKRKTVKR